MPVTFSILRSDEQTFVVKLHNYYEEDSYAQIFEGTVWTNGKTRVGFSHGQVSLDNSESTEPYEVSWGSPVVEDNRPAIILPAFERNVDLCRMHVGSAVTIRIAKFPSTDRPSRIKIQWPPLFHTILLMVLIGYLFFTDCL